MRRTSWIRTLPLLLAAASLAAGCAAMRRAQAEDTEAVLVAAGFQMQPANTPDRMAHAQALTQDKLVAHLKDGQYFYVFADADGCKCLFVGDAAAYQRYQSLAVQKEIAEDQRAAAAMNENAAMDWGLWGPFWW